MKITLNEIKTDNLRCPDIHLKFKEGLNFVQMPNGTGKTTILTLISYLFSNEWEPRLVKEMQKESTVRAKKDGKIKNLKNGTFTLILTYVHLLLSKSIPIQLIWILKVAKQK